jgi:hypothetical protein
MIINVDFAESNQTVNADFGEIYKVSDGGFEKGYAEGYENGKNSVIDLGRYASTIQFRSSKWAKEETIINLDNTTTLASLWRDFSDYVVKHLVVNCQQPIKNMSRAFYLTPDNYTRPNAMEHITINADTSQCTTFDQTFGYMYNLKVIDGTPLDLSSSSNNRLFTGVSNLEEVRFAKNTIKSKIQIVGKPSAETRQSAVDGLADLTGQETQTITFSVTYGVMLTGEQKAVITAKNWTLVY